MFAALFALRLASRQLLAEPNALPHRRAGGRPPACCANTGGEDLDAASFFRYSLDIAADSPEATELQLRSALREAVAQCETRVSVDIRVPELDAASRGFVPQLLARFALAAAGECAQAGRPPLLLFHSTDAAMQAALIARESEFGEGRAPTVVSLHPIAPSADTICGHQGPLVVVGPSGSAEHEVARGAIHSAHQQQVVVLLNYAPRSEINQDATSSRVPRGFVTAFEVLPLAVRTPEGAALRLGAGSVMKVVLQRHYPHPWKLLVNAYGRSYTEMRSFETRPAEEALLEEVSAVIKKSSSGATGGTTERSQAATDIAMPNGVRAYDWGEIDAPGAEAYRWYVASCVLRLKYGCSAAKASGEQWASDKLPGTLHIFGTDGGERAAREAKLVACALCRLDADGPCRACLDEVAISKEMQIYDWCARLVEAAETIARARGQENIAVAATQGTVLHAVCTTRGYKARESIQLNGRLFGESKEAPNNWVVKRLLH
ncbi:hypothetical protein AB1Y20_007566 [Prymnesium parvum]|uniref:DUF1995 domain-containing protein n=1 Tax=Prymnesium parvum TaxID=97485 RepID=A0AB34IVR0_PRYPA